MDPLSSVISVGSTATLRTTRILETFADDLSTQLDFQQELDLLHRLHAKLALLERLFIACTADALSHAVELLQRELRGPCKVLQRAFASSAALYMRLFEPGHGSDGDRGRHVRLDARIGSALKNMLADLSSIAEICNTLLPVLGRSLPEDEDLVKKKAGGPDLRRSRKRFKYSLRGPHSHFASYMFSRRA